MTLVRRAVTSGESVGTNPKAQLVVTMDWPALASGVRGAGVTVGGSDSGTMLAPETVRRLACNASVVPVVLGSDGEILDQGRAVRFFTPAQTRRLWLRDGGCTYPGCSMPPHWTDAHHLVHWADFGPSDLGNAALLCERHHTIVHSRRYAGRVVRAMPGSGSSGTAPSAATTSFSPAAPPRNQRDPAPHPAPTPAGPRHAHPSGPRGIRDGLSSSASGEP